MSQKVQKINKSSIFWWLTVILSVTIFIIKNLWHLCRFVSGILVFSSSCFAKVNGNQWSFMLISDLIERSSWRTCTDDILRHVLLFSTWALGNFFSSCFWMIVWLLCPLCLPSSVHLWPPFVSVCPRRRGQVSACPPSGPAQRATVCPDGQWWWLPQAPVLPPVMPAAALSGDGSNIRRLDPASFLLHKPARCPSGSKGTIKGP